MELAQPDFDFLRRLVLADSAIVLDPGKEYLVKSRLLPVLRSERFQSFSDLVRRISAGDVALRERVVDEMTTNETSFFRDHHPWESLRGTILPELIEARRSTKRLTLWCAATSSGQEPYSLAMLLIDEFPEVAREWAVRIIGTDFSPTMVHRAASGRYDQMEVNRGLPATLLTRYFTRVGAEWQIVDQVRRMVEFRRGNLVDPASWLRIPMVDGAMMRNVLIYFDPQTRVDILGRVSTKLSRDGFLMLGSTETAVGMDDTYERIRVGRSVIFRPQST